MARRHHLPHLPLVQLAVDARFPADRLRMVDCLSQLAAEDSTFHISVDTASGMVVLSGMSEAHIRAKIDALKAEPLEIAVGAPQVYYWECLTRAARVAHTHRLQQGGAGQFARVTIQMVPGPDGSGVVFKNDIVLGAVLEPHIAGIRNAVKRAAETGVLMGFPLIDFAAILVDGAYHEMDSNELTFEIATRAAMRELKDMGVIRLLEPTMRVAVTCPPECTAAVARDLEKRRAEEVKELTALVRLETMFGYERDLGELTDGRGAFTLTYDHHREVDGDNGPCHFRPAIAKRA